MLLETVIPPVGHSKPNSALPLLLPQRQAYSPSSTVTAECRGEINTCKCSGGDQRTVDGDLREDINLTWPTHPGPISLPLTFVLCFPRHHSQVGERLGESPHHLYRPYGIHGLVFSCFVTSAKKVMFACFFISSLEFQEFVFSAVCLPFVFFVCISKVAQENYCLEFYETLWKGVARAEKVH